MIQQPSIKPKYEVEKLDGKRTKTIYKYVFDKLPNGKEIQRREEQQVEVDNEYMLYTSRGDSVHVTESELRRMGINPNQSAPLFDESTGEEIGSPISLSKLSKAKELARKH